VIVGGGLARAAVEREARRAGHVHLAGAIADRDEMARHLASADALVHGSGAETYGLAVAEAILSGLPVVAPDTGGAADLAARGRSDLYATGDAAACGEAIIRTLARIGDPPGPAPSIATAEDHFTALFALYQTLIDQRRQSPATTGSQTALASLSDRRTRSVAAT
jgi:alpha-1,6-mannosyltransferase